jgi:hypothetical protein
LGKLTELSLVETLTIYLNASDVTDKGLANLGCPAKTLLVLDLTDTAITDKGLKSLAGVSLRGLRPVRGRVFAAVCCEYSPHGGQDSTDEPDLAQPFRIGPEGLRGHLVV